MPVREEPGALLRVYSGQSGNVVAPTRTHVPITMVDMTLESGAQVIQSVPSSFRAFVYLLEGSARFGADGSRAAAGQDLIG